MLARRSTGVESSTLQEDPRKTAGVRLGLLGGEGEGRTGELGALGLSTVAGTVLFSLLLVASAFRTEAIRSELAVVSTASTNPDPILDGLPKPEILEAENAEKLAMLLPPVAGATGIRLETWNMGKCLPI